MVIFLTLIVLSKGNLLEFSIRKRNNKNQFLFYSTGHKTVKNNLIKTIKVFIKKSKIDGLVILMLS